MPRSATVEPPSFPCTLRGEQGGARELDLVAKKHRAEANPRRKERHERKRQWCTHKEALKLIREWEGDSKAYEFDEGIDPDADAEAWKRGGSKKKRAKGEAFEQALHAFVEKFGYDEKF